MDSAPFYAMIIDEDHCIVAWNSQLEASHGCENLSGAYCPQRIHGTSGVYPGCPLELAARTDDNAECVIYVEETARWVRSGAYPTHFCSAEGKRLFLHLTHDITEEHHAQEQLKQSLEHHEALGQLLVRLQGVERETEVLELFFDMTLELSWMAPACGAAGFLQRGDVLELTTTRNIPERALYDCLRVPLGHCLCGTVAQTLEPLLTREHWRTCPVRNLSDASHGHATLPLAHEGRSLGVVNFYLPKDVSLNAHQRSYLESATHVAAAAIAMVQSRALAREAAERVSALERGLLERVMESQEQERRRVARELHDDLGQALSALALDVSRAAKDNLCSRDLAEMVRAAVLRLARQVHELAWDLRPSVLDDFGLDSALSRHIREMSERSGLEIDYLYQSPPELAQQRLPTSLELVVYRLVQEALNNVVRHAGATSASVVLYRTSHQITLVIEDDGRGFNELLRGAPDALGGLGLIGMRERVALLGGDLVIESTPGSGTSIRARLPLAEAGGAAGFSAPPERTPGSSAGHGTPYPEP